MLGLQFGICIREVSVKMSVLTRPLKMDLRPKDSAKHTVYMKASSVQSATSANAYLARFISPLVKIFLIRVLKLQVFA